MFSNTAFATTSFSYTDAPQGYFKAGDTFPGIQFTLTATKDTLLAGTGPSRGTNITNTNPWTGTTDNTRIVFVDNGTAGTWEEAEDIILVLNDASAAPLCDYSGAGGHKYDYVAGANDTTKCPASDPHTNTTNPWGNVHFYDGGTAGTWESTSDWIGLSDDAVYDDGTDTFSSIKVTNSGTATSTDITLALYKGDCSTGIKVADLTWSDANSAWVATGLTKSIDTTGVTYTVCVNVQTDATTGSTVQLTIPANEITLQTGNVPASDVTNASTQTIDTAAPQITFNPNAQTWTNQSVTVTISASDSESGVQKICWTTVTAGASCPTVETGYTCESADSKTITLSDTAPGSGEWKICAYAVDNVDNNNLTSPASSGTYQLDYDAPTPSASATDNEGNPYTSGTWTNKDVTVTLSATDNLSDVQKIDYTFVDGETDCSGVTSFDYSAWDSSITIEFTPPVGATYVTTICYKAVDNVGNESSVQAFVVKIDKEAPTVSFDYGGYTTGTWTNSDVTVTINADDGSGSGVASVYYVAVASDANCPAVGDSNYIGTSGASGSITISAEGKWKVCAYAADQLSNTPETATESGDVWIDKTAPEIYSVTAVDYNWGEWTASDVTVEVNAYDTNAGVNTVELHNTSDDSLITSCNDTDSDGLYECVLTANDGEVKEYNFYVKVTDNAGNEVTNDNNGAGYIVKIDKAAPTVSFTPNEQTWTNSDVTVTINASDSGSDVNKVYYVVVGKDDSCPAIDDTSYQEGTSVTITDGGEWKICAYAVDNVGNTPTTASESGVYQIDKTAPTVSITSPENGAVESGDFTVTVSASDGGSGVAEVNVVVSLETNSSITQTFSCTGTDGTWSCSITGLSDGDWLIKAVAADNVGNVGESDIIKVYVRTGIAGTITLEANKGKFVAFESNVDPTVWASVFGDYNIVILTYDGNQWVIGDPANINPLRGYYLRNLTDQNVTVPVKYTTVKPVELSLEQGKWYLISVIDDDSDNDNMSADTYADINKVTESSLESLRVVTSEGYYGFAWIIEAKSGKRKSGYSPQNLVSWLKDATAYWVYMVGPRTYTFEPPE